MVRRTAGPGSITQWISTCQCDELKFEPQDDAAKEQIMLCSACNKRISSGRVGSLTQWVFRSDLCACEQPHPVAASRRTANAQCEEVSGENSNEFSDEFFADQVDETMSVDGNSFPLDRYLALSEIGKGVSGVVYRAIDRVLQKQVAIKCLRSVTGSELMSFQKEAQATSRLNHTNIVKIFDFGASTGGAPYMVMEFVSGISLKQLIDEGGPLSEREALPLFLSLADALAHAHSKGIFHRDIKSSNVLISQDEFGAKSVRLIDFGVASLKGLESPFEKNTVLVGTPLYMAPDQVAGKSYDARSEVYSLGCLFYEVLTGVTPFIGESALETLNMHANRVVVPLFQARPDCQFSDDIEGLVLRCLAKQPDRRFQSMEELTTAIEAALANAPTIAVIENSARSSTSEIEASESKKSKVTIVMIGVGSLCFLAASLFLSRLAPPGEVPKAVALHTKTQLPRTMTEWTPPEGREKQSIRSGRLSIVTGNDKSLERLTKRSDFFELELSKCQVTEKGVACIPRKLAGLFLHKTTFDTSGLIALGDLKSLRILHIANCKWFAGEDLKVFENCPLKELVIADCNILDEPLVHLKNQSNLETLTIVNSLPFTGAGLAHLSGCTKLKHLRVSELPDFSDKSFAHIAKLSSLNSLVLVSYLYQPGRAEDELAAALGGPTAKPYDLESFEKITSIKNLGLLSLDSDRLEMKHFDLLSNMVSLKHLCLVGRKLIAPECLAKLAKLRTLSRIEFLGPCIERGGIKQICAMPGVKTVELFNCELTNLSLAAFPKSAVTELRIEGENNISAVGLEYLAKMPRLTKLRLPKDSRLTPLDLKQFYLKKPDCRVKLD